MAQKKFSNRTIFDRLYNQPEEEGVLLPPPTITPSIPPARSFLDILRQPIQTGPGQRAPIYDPLTGKMGNLPAGIINNSPIPLAARALTSIGEAEHKAYDWATTPEGATGVQNGAGLPAAAPFRASLSNAPQGGPGLTSPAAAPSGGPTAASSSLPPVALEMAQQFRAMGYSDLEVAGLVGSMLGESGGDLGAVGDAGASIGGFQWQGPRRTAFEGYSGGNTGDVANTAGFANQELNTTEAYAREALANARTPEEVAAAMLHFERPQGYSRAPGEFNPQNVSGWDRRLQATNDVYSALTGGAPLPPAVEPYVAGQQPQEPDPVDAPLPSQPDFSQVNQYLDQAAPTRAATPDRFTRMLSSLASANANTDTRGPGAVARLFANWGAGLAGGAEQADLDRISAENDFQERQRDFLLRRAEAAGQQEGALRDWRNTAGDTTFKNQQADQAAEFANRTTGYETQEANRKMGFEANQANKQNIYDWQNKQYAASQPKVLNATDKGVIVQNPDGTITNQPIGGSEMFPGYKQGELPDPLREVQKYSTLIQTGDVQVVREEVLRDSVRDGTAAQIFGDYYTQALDEATSSVDPALSSKPEIYQEAIQNAVAAKLLQLTLGNDEWIPNAAALGNIGARALVGGQ